jgi:hypothetical protein
MSRQIRVSLTIEPEGAKSYDQRGLASLDFVAPESEALEVAQAIGQSIPVLLRTAALGEKIKAGESPDDTLPVA